MKTFYGRNDWLRVVVAARRKEFCGLRVLCALCMKSTSRWRSPSFLRKVHTTFTKNTKSTKVRPYLSLNIEPRPSFLFCFSQQEGVDRLSGRVGLGVPFDAEQVFAFDRLDDPV